MQVFEVSRLAMIRTPNLATPGLSTCSPSVVAESPCLSTIRTVVSELARPTSVAIEHCIGRSISPPRPGLDPPEEWTVRASEQGCRYAASQGRRAASKRLERLHVGRWNIRWFPDANEA